MHRILVVDADAQLLTILKEDLKKHSDRLEIITVQDGLAAIMALKDKPFALVVTEIRIPIVNGLVLLAYIRKNYPKIPCIVMTGHGTPFLKRRLGQEVVHYFEKPFKVTELARTITSILSEKVVFGGVMRGLSVVGFVQLIEMEGLSCLCEISSSGTKKGYLLFDKGSLYNAFHGSLSGDEAAVKLLQMEEVTIRFRKPPEKTVPRQIETTLSGLVTEAMRVHDKKKESIERQYAGTQTLTEK